jgi:hypothetical protein
MEEEQERALLCLRCEDMPEPNTDGTLKNKCSECGAAIWVSAAGQKLMADGVKPICNRCAEPVVNDGETKMEVPAEVLKEMFQQVVVDAGRHGAKPKDIFRMVKEIYELPRK